MPVCPDGEPAHAPLAALDASNDIQYQQALRDVRRVRADSRL